MQDVKENILTSSLSRGNFEMFSLLVLQIQTQNEYERFIPLITSHLGSLSEKKINKYLPSLSLHTHD